MCVNLIRSFNTCTYSVPYATTYYVITDHMTVQSDYL